ncbi:MAG: Na(+)/H(+) antiporter subunit D [Deltaproteobacteria bacterium]|nr:Na(+)/H(+) antiporter subunit D [Deltaproteobacteria bacterium]
MTNIPPAAILILGAFLVPCFKSKFKNVFVVLLPLAAFFLISQLEIGASWHYHFFGYNLTLLRVDKISLVFGYIFTINAFAAFLYAFHLKDNTQHIAALFYVGSSLGVVFSGDLVSLYFFWEVMAVSSTFLILARRTQKAYNAGLRYILVHIFGGLCLLAGIVFYISQTGSVSFEAMAERNWGTGLILLGFLINAAAPPFSAWLSDAYPEATVTGGVILSAYTTKTAVYTLVRGYPGWEVLILVGCLMTIYGIIYALLENDMRRILAYSIINQVGFMVVGVGIGTMMSLNGSIAHAFCHIIYKALLWMSAGAVLAMVGKSKCTELGGLYKTMPWTMVFGVIGALSISSFPGTSGFTSKSLIIQGAIQQHLAWVWLVLEIASAGVFLHAGIKFPYFVFFAKDKGLRPGETNKSMLTAMGFLSFLCIFLGVYPQPLYQILPFEVTYQAYTVHHVVNQLQLLMFSGLVFFLFLPLLKRTETISIDTDWFYRRGGRLFYRISDRVLNGVNERAEQVFSLGLAGWLGRRSRDLPFRLAQVLLYPCWLARGLRGEELREKNLVLQQTLASGAAPVGIGAAVATAFLLLFFILSGLV